MATSEWKISHPGSRELMNCETFEAAMKQWFEGFNPPRLVIDGKMEDFSISSARVEQYYKNSAR